MKEKNIGDEVWWAKCETKLVIKKCPICFGKLQVKLTLGDDTEVKTPCEYCHLGFSDPRGYVEEYELVSGVQKVVIDAKEMIENESSRTVKYRYLNYIIDDSNSFDTEQEAQERVLEKIQENEDAERERQRHKKQNIKNHFSWTIGYHKRNIRKLKEELEYHERKILETKNSTPQRGAIR